MLIGIIPKELTIMIVMLTVCTFSWSRVGVFIIECRCFCFFGMLFSLIY